MSTQTFFRCQRYFVSENATRGAKTGFALLHQRHVCEFQGTWRCFSLPAEKTVIFPALAEVVFPPPSPDLCINERAFHDILVPYFGREPVLLRQALHLWNDRVQLAKWKDSQQLLSWIGPYWTGRVEQGFSYTETETMELPFELYLQYLEQWRIQYGEETEALTPPEHLLYLAQNDIPKGLRPHVPIPACLDETEAIRSKIPTLGHGSLHQVMLWMGPRGCFSPLHFDPLDNILMQFVGSKRIVCMPPLANIEEREFTYYEGTSITHVSSGDGGSQQHNTSAVHNLLGLDTATRFPHLPPVQKYARKGILGPGDVLYLPARWWHQVESMGDSRDSFCVSVNAWWR